MKKPNFFIVGAPKCGTTAMNDYLACHPDIFMATKELHHFGADLKTKTKITRSEYLAHFNGVVNESVVGEASVWYLFSKTAADEIKQFSKDAKILIMLRNPVQVLHSLHSQHLYDANEDVVDFEKALSLDEERKQGISLPDSLEFTALPSYFETVSYSEQVKRYLDHFGPANVHIVLYDDFLADTAKAVSDTFDFLEVSNKIDINFELINPNKRIKSFSLHKLVMSPSTRLKSLVRSVIPFKAVRHQLMTFIMNSNIKFKKREPASQEFELKIRQLLKNDTLKLEKIIHRDLSAWL